MLQAVAAGTWQAPADGVSLDPYQTVAAVLSCVLRATSLRDGLIQAGRLGADTRTLADRRHRAPPGQAEGTTGRAARCRLVGGGGKGLPPHRAGGCGRRTSCGVRRSWAGAAAGAAAMPPAPQVERMTGAEILPGVK